MDEYRDCGRFLNIFRLNTDVVGSNYLGIPSQINKFLIRQINKYNNNLNYPCLTFFTSFHKHGNLIIFFLNL